MGEYTALVIKGTVKKEFRMHTAAFMEGDWTSVDDLQFQKFAKISRADFIPCGHSCYFEEDYCPYADVDCKQSHPIYNEETGEWQAYCSLKDYDGTIEAFFKFIPNFMESCDILCTRFNGWDSPIRWYKMVNGCVVFDKCTDFED